ncbi:MAG: RAMP superfamily CRISPR-associated protein [Pseudomonadota bacterium]
MTLRKYDISLSVRAPFLFASEEVGAFGYDMVAHKTNHGRALIPDSQVRGLILHGLHALEEVGHGAAGALIACFGSEGEDATPVRRIKQQTGAPQGAAEGRRGRVSVSDFVSDKQISQTLPPAPRVALDEETGAAKPGQLVAVEQCFPPGEKVTFSGTFHAYVEEDIAATLELALGYHTAIGKLKSVGFGVLEDVNCAPAALAERVTPPEIGGEAATLRWRFNVDRAYLVDADLAAANAYVGKPAIPGGALKGLVAKHLEQAGASPEAFTALSAVRFGFARPLRHWPAFPRSLVYDDGRKAIIDLALEGVDAAEGALSSVVDAGVDDLPDDAFDRKEEAKYASYFAARGHTRPRPEPAYQTRIHVAIHRELQSAIDKQLFSTQAVIPPEGGFEAQVDFPAGVAEAGGREIVEAIAGALAGLGRTDAVLEPTGLSALPPAPAPTVGQDITLRLETPAFLLAEWDMSDPARAYAEAWRAILPGVEMRAHFTSEALIGGYLARRFGETRESYAPFMLTQAGSVFCLDVSGCEAADVDRIFLTGICAPRFAGDTPTTWENCPYVAANGYGAVVIHE